MRHSSCRKALFAMPSRSANGASSLVVAVLAIAAARAIGPNERLAAGPGASKPGETGLGACGCLACSVNATVFSALQSDATTEVTQLIVPPLCCRRSDRQSALCSFVEVR